jgi:hypothetical protein
MSLGALLNNILYPYDCVVPFVGVHVACAAPSFGTWLAIFERITILLMPSVFVITAAYGLINYSWPTINQLYGKGQKL